MVSYIFAEEFTSREKKNFENLYVQLGNTNLGHLCSSVF